MYHVAVPVIELSESVFSESDSVSQSLCQSQLRLTHSVRALFTYVPGTGNCNFTLPCIKESC